LTNTEKIQVKYPHISSVTMLLFCGYVLEWYLQIGYRIPALGAIRFEFIYACILTVIALLFTPKIDTDCSLLINIVLYLLVLVIQIPFSYDINTSWNVFVDRIIKFAFMSFFIVAFVRSPTHMKFFLAAFLLACMKMGQEGLIGRITGGLVWENQGIMRLHGSTPMYEHPNSFSGMAIGTLPFVYFLWPLMNKYYKVILLIIGLLSLNIIIYSGSRTAYVGIFVFILCLFLESRNKKKFLLVITVLSVVSLPLIPTDYVGRFDSIFTGKEKEGHSEEARIQILKDAWEIFLEHPFGVGLAAFPKVRQERFGRIQDTHNLYLQIATNLGIQGFIIVLLLFHKIIYVLKDIRHKVLNYLSTLESNGQNIDNGLLYDLKFINAIASATTYFIVIRLVLGMFGMDLYEIYWWFAMGICFALLSMMKCIEGALKQDNGLCKPIIVNNRFV
jgi:O-antigen ligase